MKILDCRKKVNGIYFPLFFGQKLYKKGKKIWKRNNNETTELEFETDINGKRTTNIKQGFVYCWALNKKNANRKFKNYLGNEYGNSKVQESKESVAQ